MKKTYLTMVESNLKKEKTLQQVDLEMYDNHFLGQFLEKPLFDWNSYQKKSGCVT